MSLFDDDQYEMQAPRPLDDASTEAILSGRTSGRPDEFSSVVGFIEDLRGFAQAPVPPPSAALARVLAAGVTTEKGDLPATAASNVTGPAPQAAGLPKWRRKKMSILIGGLAAKLASLSVAAKAAGAMTLATASLGGAAVAGVPVAQDAVAVVTPFSFPEKANEKADHGKTTSTDARDGGVDGSQISDAAKQRAEERRADGDRRPENTGAPEAPGSAGLDKANTTPAAGRAPTSVPASPSTAGAPQSRPSGAPDGTPSGAPEGTPTGGAPEGTPTGAPEGTPTGGAPGGTTRGAPDEVPAGAPAGTPGGRR